MGGDGGYNHPPQVFTDEKKNVINTLQIDTENEMSTFSSSVKAISFVSLHNFSVSSIPF